jgi:hypothetical protein
MMREHFVCPDCGPHVSADEDGCCATCGRDAKIEACLCREQMQAKLAAALRERDEARALLASATDLVNMACRECGAVEAYDENHIKEAIDSLWAKACHYRSERSELARKCEIIGYRCAQAEAQLSPAHYGGNLKPDRVVELERERDEARAKLAAERRRVYARCAEIADHYAKSKRLVMLRHDGPATALAIKTAIEADAEKDT